MKLTREQRKQKKQREDERLKRPNYNRKKEERKNELMDKYLAAVIGKKDTAEKIDSLLYYERNLIYLSQNADKIRKISIGIVILEIIIFLFLIMQTSFTDLSEKAVVIAGYTALVAITMPILQNMLNKSNYVYEKKIEFFLLTISELIVENKNFENSEDRIRYEEVLSKIHRMGYLKELKKEDFEIQKRKNMQDELMKEILEHKK